MRSPLRFLIRITLVALPISSLISGIQGFSPPSTISSGGVGASPLFSGSNDSPSATGSSTDRTSNQVPVFLMKSFGSECDDTNRPPSLNILLRSLQQLAGASSADIRGTFCDHPRRGSVASAAHAIGQQSSLATSPPLTPLAAYCFGYALARMLVEGNPSLTQPPQIVIGHDPRTHGKTLVDAFCRGVTSLEGNEEVQIYYTGIATTPGISTLCHLRSSQLKAGVAVTASHLPSDRNGFKLFMNGEGFTSAQLLQLYEYSTICANEWYNRGILPPTSSHTIHDIENTAVACSGWVDWMPEYADFLRQSILDEVQEGDKPLQGYSIVLNAGNGAGGFFHSVIEDLGATVCALHCEPDGNFPNGVPNPEYPPMMEETTRACEECKADLGIMLDTDADRCGFIARNKDGKYEALNRNRLIALLGVLLSQSKPGSTIVTDSVTSEGLSTFLTNNLGLSHVRFIKGYANVIRKAKELKAELAIETSGHSAFRENNYMDDGTYTAVKVLSLMAKEKDTPLLELISDLHEVEEVGEIRMSTFDKSITTMKAVFDFCAMAIEEACGEAKTSHLGWKLDTENLEGIRVSLSDSQFFMARKSLHDPIISIQIESNGKEEAKKRIVSPLLDRFQKEEFIRNSLDLSALSEYLS